MEDTLFYNNLDETLNQAWKLLAEGVSDRRSPFHTPAVATVRPDGMPSIRTVVLRGCRPDQHILSFHTDDRSAKFADLTERPAVSMLFYDDGRNVQIRCEGQARLHHNDAVAEQVWASSRVQSRQCYRVPTGPGARLSDPKGAMESLLSEEEARAHFVVVEMQVTALEWLYLAHAGHRRARFELADGAAHAMWLCP